MPDISKMPLGEKVRAVLIKSNGSKVVIQEKSDDKKSTEASEAS